MNRSLMKARLMMTIKSSERKAQNLK
jgi:hypothetical protein